MESLKNDTHSKRRGPKNSGANVKTQLLEAGAQLYAERSFENISIKDISDSAGVTQAMVRYYFNDKQGFETAMVEQAVFSIIASLERGGSFQAFVTSFLSAANKVPWLPMLVMQKIHQSNEQRNHFAKNIAPNIKAVLEEIVKNGQDKGEIRKDLNEELIPLSIISMLIYPQIARPVIEDVFDIALDESSAELLGSHIAKIFSDQTPL